MEGVAQTTELITFKEIRHPIQLIRYAMLHSTNKIEMDCLVVKAQWLKLSEKSGEGGRCSHTLPACRGMLIVNTMVRLDALQFDAGKGGPAGRELRAPKGTKAACKVYYISQKSHHALLACSEDWGGLKPRAAQKLTSLV